MRKESEICQKPFEKELHDLDLLLENSLLSHRDSPDASDVEADDSRIHIRKGSHNKPNMVSEEGLNEGLTASRYEEREHSGSSLEKVEPNSALFNSTSLDPRGGEPGVTREGGIDSVVAKHSAADQHPTPEDLNTTPPMLHGMGPNNQKANGVSHDTVSNKAKGVIQDVEPPTPPMSSGGDVQPLSNGGIPWYMDPFDPDGTTIQEERWTGRELVRGMSEELSDMDEEELSGLVDGDMADTPQGSGVVSVTLNTADVAASRRKAAAKRKRWRGYR